MIDTKRLMVKLNQITSQYIGKIMYALFLLILFVLSLFVLIRFVFVFQLHFDNPSLKVLAVFRKSAELMQGQIFRLILFALRAGGKQLAIAFFLALIVNFFPEEKHSGLSVLVFLLDIAYFVNFYTALVRIYLTVPVLYEEIENGNLKIENS